MAVHYSVQAEVVNIRSDIPRPNDVFFVDTNVWYWLTYHRASFAPEPPKPYQTKDYPEYIRKARSAGAKFFRCGLSLAELAHLIEKAELKIYIRTYGTIGSKEYRHDKPNERKHVLAQLKSAWSMVQAFASPTEILIDERTTNAAHNRLQTQSIGGYDLFMLEAMTQANISQVITDDGDFASVPAIQVFTSNINVIQAAQSQSKLLIR